MNKKMAMNNKALALFALFFVTNITTLPVFAASPTLRIVGGDLVPESRYPFMVNLFKETTRPGTYYSACGASYIGDNWVLTAAHCVVDADTGVVATPTEVAIMHGNNDLRDGELTPVTRVIVHPEYNTTANDADIALLELSRNLDGTSIGLPTLGNYFPASDSLAVAAGWGRTSEDGSTSFELLETTLPIVPMAECLPQYPSSLTSDSMICAGALDEGGRDTCQGDSGGPLFVARNNSYVQAGVVSFGAGCARPNISGVYTRVSYYVDWITSYASGYTLVDTANESNSGDRTENLVIFPLTSEATTSRSLNQGDVAVFEISPTTQRVDLSNSSGDADLFIVSGANFDKSDIICASQNEIVADSCTVTGLNTRLFALVLGFEDSEYSIQVSLPAQDDPTTIDQNDSSSSSGGSLSLLWLSALGLLASVRHLKKR